MVPCASERRVYAIPEGKQEWVKGMCSRMANGRPHLILSGTDVVAGRRCSVIILEIYPSNLCLLVSGLKSGMDPKAVRTVFPSLNN